MTDGCDISSEIAFRWTSLDLSNDKSTLVQVMAWCRQAPIHYLSQCWPRSVSPYGVTWPQWILIMIIVWYIYIYVLTRYIGSTRWSELELELKNLELECEWVISFRANFCNQLTCIPFAVTNKALPVKGLAEDPINKLIFLQFNSWLLTWKMAWIREEVVNESKQKWKLKTHQVSRNFTIYTSFLPDFHGRYTQV